LQRAGSSFQHEKALQTQLLGDPSRLRERLLTEHDQSDSIYWTRTFGKLFWSLFRPSIGLLATGTGCHME
jgi:hypothetical protein